MAKIRDKNGYIIATVDVEKEDVNVWTVVERDGYGNVIRVERGKQFFYALQTKREWLRDIEKQEVCV